MFFFDCEYKVCKIIKIIVVFWLEYLLDVYVFYLFYLMILRSDCIGLFLCREILKMIL